MTKPHKKPIAPDIQAELLAWRLAHPLPLEPGGCSLSDSAQFALAPAYLQEAAAQDYENEMIDLQERYETLGRDGMWKSYDGKERP